MILRSAQAELECLRKAGQGLIAELRGSPLTQGLHFHAVADRRLKILYDRCLDIVHYAGACHRVGRLMRLAAMAEGEWVGGIVLGSPFPNIRPRDDAFGITRYVTDFIERGLPSPWARENVEYWSRLQLVVNQARAFTFPEFRGGGLGMRMHRILESEGRRLWENRYGPIAGFDTLCTEPRSKLFATNGWILVGRTKGYGRDPRKTLSARVARGEVQGVRDNAALSRSPDGVRWWVWVRVLNQPD
jgi:hypothetical protein